MNGSSWSPRRSPSSRWTADPQPPRRGLTCVVPILVLGALLLAAAPLPAAQPMDHLEQLRGALRQHDTWQAEYRQEYLPPGLSVGERIAGTVWLAWPDRAVFGQGAPPSSWMGLEGRRFRLVDLEARSCEDHLLSEEDWLRVPLAAVLDPARAVDRFTVLEHGERGFALVPRSAGGVRRVEVELTPAGLPARVRVIDPQGAVNTFSFTGWCEAPAPPGGRWLPRPPRGVECVTDDALRNAG